MYNIYELRNLDMENKNVYRSDDMERFGDSLVPNVNE